METVCRASGPVVRPPPVRRGLLEALGEAAPRKRCMSASQLNFPERSNSPSPSLPTKEKNGKSISPLPTSVTFDELRGSRLNTPSFRRQSIAGGRCATDLVIPGRDSDLRSNLTVKTDNEYAGLAAPVLPAHAQRPSLSPHDSPEAQSQRSSISFPSPNAEDATSVVADAPLASLHSEYVGETMASNDHIIEEVVELPDSEGTDANMSSCEDLFHCLVLKSIY